MIDKKWIAYIPLLIITLILMQTSFTFIFEDDAPTRSHYMAMLLLIPLIYLQIKNLKKGILATGIYLICATFTVISITPSNTQSWMIIGPLTTPAFNTLSLSLLMLFFILNFDLLINMLLDHKESRAKQSKSNSLENSSESNK